MGMTSRVMGMTSRVMGMTSRVIGMTSRARRFGVCAGRVFAHTAKNGDERHGADGENSAQNGERKVMGQFGQNARLSFCIITHGRLLGRSSSDLAIGTGRFYYSLTK